MPSTYAHFCFGREIYKRLPAAIKNIVGEQPQLFNIGLHGPDIFFYYKPLTNNPVNTLGFRMHNQPASDFFLYAADVLEDFKKGSPEYKASLSYLMGFICHFVLDSTCHGYIENKIRVSGLSHTTIETEFDRHLMIKDHLNPLSHHLTDHIHPTPENVLIIHHFFDELTVRQIYKSLKSMIWYNDLLVAPGKIKRSLILALLKLTGNYREMHGLIVSRQPVETCSDSCLRLEKLFTKAIELGLTLLKNYWDYIINNEPIDKYFIRTFGPEMNWQSIPVYSYQEELTYEI
ncbi:hypothetical protein HNP82_002978 [Catenibacillus scindens]|uniref:Phospholipase C/D domain-containing protein n=1 Tax=Catenibacillus scindens TaxID=673271 RepID=A0A7W8HDS4_9FIRM|nr:zinc dependent phospholipase C family protein [Catenibacillus scindens]MBB5265827.1 hypothetical protein [Catenibacillus scindens]